MEKDPCSFAIRLPDLLKTHLKNQLREFQVILIDVEKYLENLQASGRDVNREAIDSASEDKEVLLLPADPMSDGVGQSALFHMSGISSIDFYRF